MAYFWTVTKDHIADEKYNRVGVSGPGGDYDLEAIKATGEPSRWQAFDDDGELYYEGLIWGDFTGWEPLDDFAQPDAGATSIRLNGREL